MDPFLGSMCANYLGIDLGPPHLEQPPSEVGPGFSGTPCSVSIGQERLRQLAQNDSSNRFA